MSPTRAQLQQLRDEAATAGDHAQVLICDLATGDVTLDEYTTLDSLRVAAFLSPQDRRRIAGMSAEDALFACEVVLDRARAQV